MRRFLAKHFPTFARFGAEDWIMLTLVGGISWSILYGIALPYVVPWTTCFEGYGPACY